MSEEPKENKENTSLEEETENTDANIVNNHQKSPASESSSSSTSEQPSKEALRSDDSRPKEKSKMPKNNAFYQQRLPAWRPVMTPKTFIPSLFAIGAIFVPLGVLFLITALGVYEYRFDYTECLHAAPSGSFQPAPAKLGSHPFEWKRGGTADKSAIDEVIDGDEEKGKGQICLIRFKIDKELEGPVFLYYRLSNYYQNQRLYVRSVDWKQLRGEVISKESLASTCSPLVGPDSSNLVYYPCGLIANSMFNDTIGSLYLEGGTARVFSFPPKGITWPGESKRYGPSQYRLEQIRPPPFWRANKAQNVDPNTGLYTRIPDLAADERFQVWMRVSGLPVFRKLYGAHRSGSIPPGQYVIPIRSVFEVESYGGRKAVVISTSSWIGGRNFFLPIAYMVVGSICLLLGTGFLIQNMRSPRRLGDLNYLSWKNNPQPIR